MKTKNKESSQQPSRNEGGRLGRIKSWTLVALTAGVMAVETPSEAKIKWKHVLGVVCTVGGVAGGLTGHVEVGVALIGLQGTLLGSSAIIANNTNIITGPDVTPVGLMGLGAAPHTPAATEALLAMNCPDVPVAGTPAEQFFIQKANVVIGLGRDLRTATNPVVASEILHQMSTALDAAASAYDALGLPDEVTQAQWDDFKLDCAEDGVAPALEENYLIACGLNAAQRNALNLDQAAQRSVLDHRIKYKPGTVIRHAAALLSTNNVGFADLLHQPIGNVALSQPAGVDGVRVQWGSSAGGISGVNVPLPGVSSWDGYWSELDADDMLPIGAFVESSATGDAFGAVTNGPLGSWRMTKLGSSNYVVTADFSPLGATHVTVHVFNGTNLVHTAGGLSGNLAIVNGCVSDDHWGRPTPKPVLGGALTLRGPKDIQVGTSFVVGDRIAIVPESAPIITAFNSVSITAEGVPSLTLTNESIPSLSSRPLIRWPKIGVRGVFGGCFPGHGICFISPTETLDSTPVMLTFINGLKLEFLTSQASATNVFTISEPIPLDEEAAHEFGFAKIKILPGQYPVDYSQNPFGTVHLNTASDDIAIEPAAGEMVKINWVNNGVNILEETEDMGGSWTNMPVQVTKPTTGYRRPPLRFFRVRYPY